MKTLQVGDVVSDYRVIGIAGSGGMGTVYKIEHLITRRIEAMKLLPAGLSAEPEQLHRFEREIQVQARLHHPNIVALYNAVRDGDSIALVMEFVEGDSLQRMVAAGPLPVETAVYFTSQVLQALAYAHDAGVIHRDVSPANIIITSDRVAKLSDFGLALAVTDPRISTTGVALGSPWYMSPEQVRGLEKLDARTDLYAIGAVLHEMLTGRKLFEAEGSFAVMRAHVEAMPQPPGSLNPKVTPALDAVVSKAVAKDPAMRFQSADEFRMALQRCAVEAGAMPRPSSTRKTWFAGFHGVFPALPPRFTGVHISRSAVLVALVPAVLTAAFFAVRLATPVQRAPLTPAHPAASEVGRTAADRPSPAVPAQTEPEAPPVAATQPIEPPVPEASIAPALPRAKSPVRTLRRAPRTEPDTSLRITGGESHPVAAMPAPRRDTAPIVETPEPAGHKTNSAEAPGEAPPEMVVPDTTASPSEPAGASPADATANPPNGGNRFVRALGKVNPFRRLKKNDAVKEQLKKD